MAPGWSILTAAIFVMLNERLQMAGEWFIGGIEAKDFAYVFMLLGLEVLVTSRWNRAWLLFGAAAGFHPLVGGWAVVAAAMAWLFLGKKYSPHPLGEGPGVRAETSVTCPRANPLPKGEGTGRPKLSSMLPGLIGGFLLSLPGLVPALVLNRNIDVETIRHANVIYVFERLRHHLDVLQFRMDFVLRFAALTACYLAWCWMVNRLPKRESCQESADEQPGRCNFLPIRILQYFVAGALSIALVGVLVDMTSLYDRTLAAGLLRFYWFRLADIALPLGTAFVASFWIERELAARSRSRKIWGYLGLGVAVVLSGIHFGSYIPQRIKPSPARADRLDNPPAWEDACAWVSANTPRDARFFTPRQSQTFKWYARRTEVVTWKDIPQDAAGLAAWWNRIEEVFMTGSPQPEFRWRENATDMEPAQLKELAKKYGAAYIIAPVGNRPPGWEEIYRNQRYVVLRISERM